MITDTITEEARDQIRQMQGEIDRLTKQLVSARGALEFLLQTKWKSIDRDNMEFEGRVTCFQLDRARAALTDDLGDPK